jgi:hypothetical protein
MANTVKGMEGRATDARRIKPADRGPPSPAEVKKLYAKDMRPEGHGMVGDGLTSKAEYEFYKKMHAPQDLGDRDTNGRMAIYDNDVPEKGARSWLRGGQRGGESYSCFDRTGVPKNAPGGGHNTATGKDMRSSPFSRAAKTWSE